MVLKEIEAGTNQTICQKWEESERGWGERPDGFSLHLSFEGLHRYLTEYWDEMPDEVPDEYSRPCGTPYPVGVSDEVVDQIEEAGGSLRFFEFQCYTYPGSGGIDGWMSNGSGHVKSAPSEED